MTPMISLNGTENYLDGATVMKMWEVLRENVDQFKSGLLHIFPAFNQVPYEQTLKLMPRRLRLSLEKPSKTVSGLLKNLAANGLGAICEFEGFHSTGGTDTMKLLPVDSVYVPTPNQVASAWSYLDGLLDKDSIYRGYPRNHERGMGITAKARLHISAPALGSSICDVCGEVIDEELWLIEQFKRLYHDGYGWPDTLPVTTPCGHQTELNRLGYQGFAAYGVCRFHIVTHEVFDEEVLSSFERILETPLRQMCHQL